jgi:hypothetical protein
MLTANRALRPMLMLPALTLATLATLSCADDNPGSPANGCDEVRADVTISRAPA